MKRIFPALAIAFAAALGYSDDEGSPLDIVPFASKGGNGGTEGDTKTVISTHSGDRTGEAAAINASDQVVGGSVSRTGLERGFFYSGGSLQNLGPGSPNDLSGFSDVVGIDDSPRALVW